MTFVIVNPMGFDSGSKFKAPHFFSLGPRIKRQISLQPMQNPMEWGPYKCVCTQMVHRKNVDHRFLSLKQHKTTISYITCYIRTNPSF